MSLYLVRHAHAVSAEEDSQRPLSKKGRTQVRALADFLAPTQRFVPTRLWHSPLARSRQTAELLAKHLDLPAEFMEVAGMQGEDDPQTLARRLASASGPLAIVGHEPHLSGLATILLTGEAQPARVVLKKGAIVALERADKHWAVRWHISPELLP